MSRSSQALTPGFRLKRTNTLAPEVKFLFFLFENAGDANINLLRRKRVLSVNLSLYYFESFVTVT